VHVVENDGEGRLTADLVQQPNDGVELAEAILGRALAVQAGIPGGEDVGSDSRQLGVDP
jgi:hypothetical protein